MTAMGLEKVEMLRMAAEYQALSVEDRRVYLAALDFYGARALREGLVLLTKKQLGAKKQAG